MSLLSSLQTRLVVSANVTGLDRDETRDHGRHVHDSDHRLDQAQGMGSGRRTSQVNGKHRSKFFDRDVVKHEDVATRAGSE